MSNADAIAAALAKAKGESATVEATKVSSKRGGDKAGKAPATASDADSAHPKPSPEVAKAVADATPALREHADAVAEGAVRFAEVLKPEGEPEDLQEDLPGTRLKISDTPADPLPIEAITGDAKLIPGDAILVLNDVGVPVVIGSVDADGNPTLDEESSEHVEQILHDVIKLQPPQVEGSGRPNPLAVYDQLPPVNHGGHPTFRA